MKTIKNPNFKNSLKYSFLFIILIVLISVYGCDTFEEDALSSDNGVELSSGDIKVLANSSSVIDFNRIVKTQETVSVKITDEPDNGEFKNVENNLFSYKPDEDFLEGKDAVGFDVIDTDDKVIKSGTIDIVVSQDKSDFPCAIFALEDNAVLTNGQMVTVDVLANDILCNVSLADLEVSIVKTPGVGEEADIKDKKLRFFPGSGFEFATLVYKVNRVNEPDSGSYGIVNIAVEAPACEFEAKDDVYNYTLPLDGQTALEVDILVNDILCLNGSAPDAVSIVETTKFGDAAIQQGNRLVYWPNLSKGTYSDSLVYQVCKDQDCDRAKVTFNFTSSQCEFEAKDDVYNYYLPLAPSATDPWGDLEVDILVNDLLCLGDSEPDIVRIIEAAKFGPADILQNKLYYFYDATKGPYSDSMTYEVCKNQNCDIATVTFNFKAAQSDLVQGINDAYNLLVLGQRDTYTFGVMDNDQFTNLSNADISIVTNVKHGQAWMDDKLLWYSPAIGTQETKDTLVYRICEEIDGVLFCDEAVVDITIQ
ncbi:hypothetical protein FNH22_14475 [Fulvivirga sp. M361]|uniref:hypothetical protein n=1 Tax=Fulvivirga sp. M361 TaxID=2594266 RepID=UPI00117AC49B|nr:hypothetical protein [Fulvivirga sp. M361]TRX58260.1 hypothetical protein FNH22_14475 [Fulvivirga sp. M361]